MRLCIFCGSQQGNLPVYRQAATDVGRLLAEHGIGIVYGGGHVGLMGVVADAALQAGGEVLGVIPQSMVDSELAHLGLTKLHIVDTMHQRKALMVELSEGFLALPGGYGTADELFEVLTWAQLRLHANPIGLLNVAGFFDPLIAWVDRCVQDGFVKPKYRGLLSTYPDVGAVAELLVKRSC